MSYIITTPLVAAGGTPPYNFSAPASDPETTLRLGTFSVTGSTLSVDATTLSPGEYKVRVIVTDAGALHSADLVISVLITDPTLFTILNQDQNFEPSSFPATQSIPLLTSGGTGTVTWSLIPSATTLPGAIIDSSNNLNFTFSNFGTWAVGLTATDSLNKKTSTVIEVGAILSQAYALVDGRAEISLTVPPQKSGTRTFTLGITDSNPTTPSSLSKTFTYKADNPVSSVYLEEASFEHFWGSEDTTTVVLPISGDLGGYTINSQTTTLSNGLVVTVDGTNKVVSATGPATVPANSQVYVEIPIFQGGNQVATISREYTLLAHGGTTDIGAVQTYTRPYMVGDFVSLNPLKPWFNSPNVSKNSSFKARVAAGSTLPPGLSLDANTALIYGTLTGIALNQSTIEYIDSSNVVQATINITWDTSISSFSLQDNIVDGNLQQPYVGSPITTTSLSPITAVSVYRGHLPQGLVIEPTPSLSPVTTVSISGTPTEAGQFDLWIRATNANGQNGYLYHRFVVDYVNPLVIQTTMLPTITTGQAYNFALQAIGGTAPYTWALATGSSLPTGLTLNTAGLISGTTSETSYSQNLTFNLTDSAGATTSATLLLAINNKVRIVTTVLPGVVPGQNYSFSMVAAGGTTPYVWTLLSGTLPPGIIFTDGVFSGFTSSTTYPSTIIDLKVTDAALTTASQTYTLQLGSPTGMLIDTSGVGSIDRGAPYQGLLRAYETFASPITWFVAPDSPNPLPSGLNLAANSSGSGITAYISGSSTTIFPIDPAPSYPVKVTAMDSTGSSAEAVVLLNTTSLLAITTTNLPQGVVSAPYSYQLQATGYNTPLTWSLATGSLLPVGYSLNSTTGVITGTATAAFSGSVIFQVTDALGDTYRFAPMAQLALNLDVKVNTLAVSTTSLANAYAGRAYTQTLSATGGSTPYIWSIAPSSPNQLPVGLSLNPSSGVISGVTNLTNSGIPIVFRVTDTTGAYRDSSALTSSALTLTVLLALSLATGIDYTDGYSPAATNCLGYVCKGSTQSINPSPNNSFHVIATGILTTNPATLLAGISISDSRFTATVESLISGTAYISVSGPFASGVIGTNNFGITVTDTGVSATGRFNWVVYNDGVIRFATAIPFPQQIV